MTIREILFKAKRLDNGEWIEGYYQKRKDAFANDKHMIFRCESYHAWEYEEVSPDTLCQYTGLTDKNGNKIWENDIVEVKDFSCGIYLFREQPLKRIAIVWNKKEAKFERKDGISLFKASDFKVLGNIFDNPELMENE